MTAWEYQPAVDILHRIRISPAIIVLLNKNQISYIKSGNNVSILCLRLFHIESTSSRLITEVKQCPGLISTWMGDRLGIPAAVDIFTWD